MQSLDTTTNDSGIAWFADKDIQDGDVLSFVLDGFLALKIDIQQKDKLQGLLVGLKKSGTVSINNKHAMGNVFFGYILPVAIQNAEVYDLNRTEQTPANTDRLGHFFLRDILASNGKYSLGIKSNNPSSDIKLKVDSQQDTIKLNVYLDDDGKILILPNN